jgi:HK97 family phage prohead protease
MKVEIREDSVVITGYVNAIERYSKPIRESIRGKIVTFIERIKAGVFKTALDRNEDVKVLLNHDHERVLATTKDGSAKLEEDNIGLRAEVTISDKEVVEKARNNQLVGWSFGFYANADEMGNEGETETRTITDMDLIEVSILDDTKSPAYYGTSIEARSENEKVLEYRAITDEIEAINEEAYKKHDEVFEESEEAHKQIEEEKMNALIDIVVGKVLEKLNGTGEEETTPRETPVEEDKVEEENRSTNFDYSKYEERIEKLRKA